MTKLSKWRNNNRPRAPDILAIHNSSDTRGNCPVGTFYRMLFTLLIYLLHNVPIIPIPTGKQWELIKYYWELEQVYKEFHS